MQIAATFCWLLVPDSLLLLLLLLCPVVVRMQVSIMVGNAVLQLAPHRQSVHSRQDTAMKLALLTGVSQSHRQAVRH